MKNKLIEILLLFIILAALQLTLINFITIENIGPQLLVIFVLYYSLKLKNSHSLLFGFFTGLLFDLITGGITGVNAFAFTFVSFIANKSKHKFEGNIFPTNYFVWLVFVSSSVASFFINFFYGNSNNLLEAVLLYGIISGIYTTLFALPLILFLKGRNPNG